jgi:hypothetical protein
LASTCSCLALLDAGFPGQTPQSSAALSTSRVSRVPQPSGAGFGCGSSRRTRPGPWTVVRASAPTMPIFFSTAVSRTGCCRSCYPEALVAQLFDRSGGLQVTLWQLTASGHRQPGRRNPFKSKSSANTAQRAG